MQFSSKNLVQGAMLYLVVLYNLSHNMSTYKVENPFQKNTSILAVIQIVTYQKFLL